MNEYLVTYVVIDRDGEERGIGSARAVTEDSDTAKDLVYNDFYKRLYEGLDLPEDSLEVEEYDTNLDSGQCLLENGYVLFRSHE